MFSRTTLGEKYPNCESGGRKSKYRDATDFLPTAKEDKLGLNPLSLLRTHHKYINEVGKPSRRCFPAAIWAKNPKYESGGRKSTYCDATDFQPSAQQVKLGLNLL